MRIIAIVFLAALTSCIHEMDDKNYVISNPNNFISFEVIQTNSDHNFTSKVKKFDYISKSSFSETLNSKSEDSVLIWKHKKFKLELENGDTLSFEIGFQQEESANLVKLEKVTPAFHSDNWDYKTFEDEKERFYKGFNIATISLTYNYLAFSNVDSNFKIINVVKVKENKVEKTYIEATFSGKAFGYYDPTGEYMPVLEIKNGVFKGIIE